jgi:hypothetical protein
VEPAVTVEAPMVEVPMVEVPMVEMHTVTTVMHTLRDLVLLLVDSLTEIQLTVG